MGTIAIPPLYSWISRQSNKETTTKVTTTPYTPLHIGADRYRRKPRSIIFKVFFRFPARAWVPTFWLYTTVYNNKLTTKFTSRVCVCCFTWKRKEARRRTEWIVPRFGTTADCCTYTKHNAAWLKPIHRSDCFVLLFFSFSERERVGGRQYLDILLPQNPPSSYYYSTFMIAFFFSLFGRHKSSLFFHSKITSKQQNIRVRNIPTPLLCSLVTTARHLTD
jgi:hypothetical protein